MIKVTKAQVKATIRAKGEWRGYIVGNKVNPRHIANGWCFGAYVTIQLLSTWRKVLTLLSIILTLN